MTEEKIRLDHMEINVQYSLKAKPVILFIHFSGGNLQMWKGIMPQFADQYSIIAPDMRGHGKSDKPLAGYHIDEMANDIYLLLKKLDIKSCHVVGSSMGAEIGLSLAASHPEIVLSLVCEGALCNEFGEYGLFHGSEDEIQHKKEVMRAELAERQDRIFKTKEEYIEEKRAELTQQGIWNEYFAAFFEHSLQQMPDGNFTYCYLNFVRTEYVQNYWDVKFEQYYKKVKCPVLFLPSEEEWKDEKVRRNLAVFTSLLEAYEVVRIEDSIHAYVWMQLPLAAGEAIRKFISKKDR